MKFSKNRKKHWRKCMPGIDEDIVKANELKEIEPLSFGIVLDQPKKQIKYSTVPRTTYRTIRKPVKNEAIDVWASDEFAPDLSKRRRKMIESVSRYNKPVEAIPSGISWFPQQQEHMELLEKMQHDQMLQIAADEKYVIKESAFVAVETPAAPADETEEQEDTVTVGEGAAKRVPRPVSSKQRRQRLANVIEANRRHKIRAMQRHEAHQLGNLPRIGKELTRLRASQVVRTARLRAMGETRRRDRAERAALRSVPVLLPSELAPCMRLMTAPDTDLLSEFAARAAPHKFRTADKPTGSAVRKTPGTNQRRGRRLKKTFNKRGIFQFAAD